MNKLDFKNISDIVNDYDVFLFDLWGVVIEGQYTYPNVVDNINKIIASRKVFFVSNAPRNTFFLLQMVKSWGLNATSEMIISSGEVAVDMILRSKEQFGIEKPVIYHLGYGENDIINGIQCPITDNINDANILLLTLHRDEGENLDLDEFDDILKMSVKRGMINICANPDIGINQRGIYRYCAGYYAQKLKQFGGEVVYTGKPYGEIYNKVLNQLDNVPKNRILMIGDTFYTDILGANKLGIDSALVLTGNAEKFHSKYNDLDEKLVQLKIAALEQDVMPTFVVKLN
ncbi:TIGR01459 family HAD-type hydrolase [Rickettsia endosymbiont of Polydrusus tereticollis]|uniref:TIGR01459 family HAD-type hydrolase n=1 Tax=Rickettsia endosymbiont of Polydrusus tereticollis TaxID=3066251 RepID=UPI00313337F1